MRLLPYLHLLILAACAAPSIGVMGGQSDSVRVGDYLFDVNYKGEQAEAYRANLVWSPKQPEVLAAGAVAMELVTGCRVDRGSIRGDVGIVQADLIC